jgi:hypothetical protein
VLAVVLAPDELELLELLELEPQPATTTAAIVHMAMPNRPTLKRITDLLVEKSLHGRPRMRPRICELPATVEVCGTC